MYLIQITSKYKKDRAVFLQMNDRVGPAKKPLLAGFIAKRKHGNEWIFIDKKVNEETATELATQLKHKGKFASYLLPRFNKIRAGMKLNLDKLIKLPSAAQKNYNVHDFLRALRARVIK